MKSKIVNFRGVAFICTPDDMHPYACDQHCIHCKRKSTRDHRVRKCALCNRTKKDASK